MKKYLLLALIISVTDLHATILAPLFQGEAPIVSKEAKGYNISVRMDGDLSIYSEIKSADNVTAASCLFKPTRKKYSEKSVVVNREIYLKSEKCNYVSEKISSLFTFMDKGAFFIRDEQGQVAYFQGLVGLHPIKLKTSELNINKIDLLLKK
jgi:hypothetical protein